MKEAATEAALLPGYAVALFTHERVVSVNLASKSRPAASEIFQSMGFSLTLRQFHQAMTFRCLIPELAVNPAKINAFKGWCPSNDIEWQEPKWLLCRMYG